MTSILVLVSLALAAEPIALDAGTLATPLQDGFQRLHLEGCDDPRVRWVEEPTGAAWERGPDALAGDHLQGGGLHLDVPPGTWEIRALMGWGKNRYEAPWPEGGSFGLRAGEEELIRVDVPTGPDFLDSEWYARNPYPVFRPGETEWERQVVSRHPWHTAQVEVGEDGLDLAPFGWPLAALVMAPAQRTAELDVLVEVADIQRRSWYLEHIVPGAAERSLPALDGGSLRVQVARWTEEVDPSRVDPEPVLSREVAPGERFTVPVWLHGSDEEAGWEVVGLDELGIEAAEIHWLDQTWFTDKEHQPRPAFLRPSHGTLRGGQGVPVGLSLAGRVPAGEPPGVLEGALRLSRGEEHLVVPVRLRVRDLVLEEPAVEAGFFADLRIPLSHTHGPGSEAVLHALDRDIALMRERGARALGIRMTSRYPEPGYSVARWPHGEPPDTRLLDEVSTRWRDAGGRTLLWVDPMFAVRRPAFVLTDGPILTPVVEEQVLALARAAVANDAEFYIWDEEGGKNATAPDRLLELAAFLREEGPPGLRLAGCTSHPVAWRVTGALDVGCQHHKPVLYPERFQALRDAGARPMVYNLPHGRSAGLVSWSAGVDLYLQWHWNDQRGDAFNHAHAGPHPWSYTLLAPDGTPWSTTPLEAWSEGWTDHRYLTTLERLVAAHETHPRAGVRRRAERGRALLDAARSAVVRHPVLGGHHSSMWSPAALELLRDAVGDEAERLQRTRGIRKRLLRESTRGEEGA